jgi:hypothetical protein
VKREDGLGIDRHRDDAAIDKRRALTYHVVDEVRGLEIGIRVELKSIAVKA